MLETFCGRVSSSLFADGCLSHSDLEASAAAVLTSGSLCCCCWLPVGGEAAEKQQTNKQVIFSQCHSRSRTFCSSNKLQIMFLVLMHALCVSLSMFQWTDACSVKNIMKLPSEAKHVHLEFVYECVISTIFTEATWREQKEHPHNMNITRNLTNNESWRFRPPYTSMWQSETTQVSVRHEIFWSIYLISSLKMKVYNNTTAAEELQEGLEGESNLHRLSR